MDAAFLAEIDRVRGGRSRSDFLREALFEHLKRAGVHLPEALKHGPDRTGKGGRPRKTSLKPMKEKNSKAS